LYKKILIAVDNSKASKKAAIKGVELAKKQSSKVLGVHILDVDALNIMDAGSDEVNRLREHQKEKGEEALKLLEELAKKKGLDFDQVLREGEPDKEILKIADYHDADLIVMGTHGRHGLRKLIDPNTSDEAKKVCPDCPIMIVV
jgi:nucleotide-binding universal stress UspA family protein